MYACKRSVKLVCIYLIHFCIVERQQVRKHFPMHVGYLETYQHCASLLLRSLSLCSSLSTWPTQERQLCVGRTIAIFNRHDKYMRRWEGQSSCNPTSLKRAVEYLGCLLKDRFDRKALQPQWERVHVRRLDLEYLSGYDPYWQLAWSLPFTVVFWEWSHMRKQLIPGRFLSSHAA